MTLSLSGGRCKCTKFIVFMELVMILGASTLVFRTRYEFSGFDTGFSQKSQLIFDFCLFDVLF